MKEYKGYGGNTVTIDGDNVLINQMLKKENCTVNDIISVNLIQPTLLKNGSLVIATKKATYKIIFLKKSLDEFKELCDLINEKAYTANNNCTSIVDSNDKDIRVFKNKHNEENKILSNVNDKVNKSIKNAKDMYQYCIDNNYGMGMSESWGIKHFELIEKSLGSDEKILMCFIGLHNYVSMTKHDSNFAYAVTNKRIIIAQKKVIGEIFQTVSLKNVNDITMVTGMVMGTITIDTIRETFNVGVNKNTAKSINEKIHEVIMEVQDSKTSSTVQPQNADPIYSSADEILKFKKLLDLGVITREEFDIKKKQILGI